MIALDVDGDSIPSYKEGWQSNWFKADTDGDGFTDDFDPKPKFPYEKPVSDVADKLPLGLRDEFIDAILGDSYFSVRETHNVNFLLEPDQLDYAVSNDLVLDFDWDGDNMDNGFEYFIADTEYDVKNERYFFLFYTEDYGKRIINPEYMETNSIDPFSPINASSSSPYDEIRHIMKKNRVNPDNIIEVHGKDANYSSLSNILTNLSKKVSSNDFLFMTISAHGRNESCFISGIGEDVFYWDVRDKLLDPFDDRCNIAISLPICYSRIAVDTLSEKQDHIIVNSGASHLFFAHSTRTDWLRESIERLLEMDSNEDGVASIQEILVSFGRHSEGSNDYKYNKSETPVYLGDATIEELSSIQIKWRW